MESNDRIFAIKILKKNIYKHFSLLPGKITKETLLFLVIKRKPYQVTFTKVYVLVLSTVLFRLLVIWFTEYAAW